MAGSRGTRSAEGRRRRRELFSCLARAGRFRDEETAEHVERMSRTSALIARELRFHARDRANLRIASALHDIGKIGVPDAVLLKPAALDADERAILERHPEIGYQILAGSRDPTMRLAATIALTHHERVDGRGYPRRLCGDQIPLAGRIAAVADVFDALTHDRVYRPALSVDSARSILHDGRGTQFDVGVLDAFERVLPEVLELQDRYRSREVPDEGDCGDRRGRRNGRDEAGGAARAAGSDQRRRR